MNKKPIRPKNKPIAKIKRLYYDIETSPNVGLFFSCGYGKTINPDAIVEERKIICIAWMWEWDEKPTVIHWDREQNDLSMLKKFAAVAEEADEMVAHYGDNFDLPWFRTRCLILGLDPLPFYKTVDTKAIAARNFCFNSNKLDYIGQVLGVGAKDKMEWDDWKLITLYNDKERLEKMCHYCGVDVIRLKGVYQKLSRWFKPKTHAGVFGGNDKWSCSHCGSENVIKSKTRATANGTVQHQMRCSDCHGYYSISNTAHSQYLERKKPVAKRVHAKKR